MASKNQMNDQLSLMFLSNTPMHKSTIPPVIGILSKATWRKLYEQSQWRNLGLSVWFKGTTVIVAPSNSSVYESSFLWLEHSPFRSVVQICNLCCNHSNHQQDDASCLDDLWHWAQQVKVKPPCNSTEGSLSCRRIMKLHRENCTTTASAPMWPQGFKGNAPEGFLILEKMLVFMLPSVLFFQLLLPVFQFHLITTSNHTTDTGSERFVMLKKWPLLFFC